MRLFVYTLAQGEYDSFTIDLLHWYGRVDRKRRTRFININSYIFHCLFGFPLHALQSFMSDVSMCLIDGRRREKKQNYLHNMIEERG